MIAQAILKSNRTIKYRFENVRNMNEAKQKVIAKGDDPKRYDWEYVYKTMQRKPYSAGYAKAHLKAAREHARRKSGTYIPGRGRGRPKKENS